MSDGTGNYSFYNHNLRRPSIEPNRLTRQSSSENALNNFETLSILSPSVDSHEQPFAGEPIVSGFVPHPPSFPRSKDKSDNHPTPIRFRGRKRSRNDSPRTSGSEEERVVRKQALSSNISPLSTPLRCSSDGSISGFNSDPEFQRRSFRGLEPLKGIRSDRELVSSFKTYQHSVKCDSRNDESCHPLKVTHDVNGNNRSSDVESQVQDKHSTLDEENCVIVDVSGDDKIETDLSLSDDSFTNVSGSEDDDTTLSSSSESDEELKKQSEVIAQALNLKHYPNATLPSIPKNTTLNSNTEDDDTTLSSSSESDQELKKQSKAIAQALTLKRNPNATLPSIPKNTTVNSNSGLYETMDANISIQNSTTYESVSGFQRILDESNDLRSRDNRYASDTELSKKADSEFSCTSQSSLLPRVHARTVRLRNTNFLEEEMDKYLPDRKVGIFVATWNMHEEKDIPGFLDDFLLPENVDFLQDIYVVGLQESTSFRKEWEIKLQETLGPSHVLMYSCSFGVLHMAVFIRRELVWFISAVHQNSVGTRPGHMIKTKGGLAVSFSLFGTSFLFINSHLTSDEGKSKDRINDYNIIRKSLTLQAVEKPLIDNRPDATDRFDRVFWLGDFNFRVDMTRKEVDSILQQNKEQNRHDLKEIQKHDQLLKLMNKGEVFCGFTEPDVNFPPTYKYDLNSDTYDSSSKSRVPSWTDRILYKPSDEESIKSTCYSACSSVIISDHRPVYGIYEVTLKPCKKSIPLSGGQFVRDVYIEANRRRSTANQRSQQESSVCTIL